jgi:hypothetical protein
MGLQSMTIIIWRHGMDTFISHLVAQEISRFFAYHGIHQFLYLFYIISGLVLPWGHVRRWKKLRQGNSGIGDGCISSEIYMAFWRLAPLIYSFTVISSFPLFLSVASDLAGRVAVIIEMQRSHKRAEAIDEDEGEFENREFTGANA